MIANCNTVERPLGSLWGRLSSIVEVSEVVEFVNEVLWNGTA